MRPERYVDSHMPGLVSDLQALIRQPSVSATNEGIEQCASLVKKMLDSSGIRSEVLRLGKGAAPLVYCEVMSKSNPSKTLLFYNHILATKSRLNRSNTPMPTTKRSPSSLRPRPRRPTMPISSLKS